MLRRAKPTTALKVSASDYVLKMLKRLVVAREWGAVARAGGDGLAGELAQPLGGGVFALAAVRRDARAHAADDRRVDRAAGDDGLPLGERGEVVEQVVPDALDGGGDALLVHLVDDAHDALRQALAEHVGVELAGTLADEADADAELAPLREHLLEHLR